MDTLRAIGLGSASLQASTQRFQGHGHTSPVGEWGANPENASTPKPFSLHPIRQH